MDTQERCSVCTGVLNGELGSSLGGAALVLCCGAGGVACGLPLWLMPAPLIAASGIALFYDSGMPRATLVLPLLCMPASQAASGIALFFTSGITPRLRCSACHVCWHPRH